MGQCFRLFVRYISGPRSLLLFLAEFGSAMSVASTTGSRFKIGPLALNVALVAINNRRISFIFPTKYRLSSCSSAWSSRS